MNDFMELRKVITSVLRRWWLLVLLIAIGAILGYAISRAQTPVYQASTTVLVGESITSSRVDRVDIQISEALIQTYVEIARRQPVMQGVVTTLNLNESWQNLSKRVTVNYIESTQLIEIAVEANSPEQARIIADEIVNQLILLSPSSSESTENQLTSSFNREQITKLQERIVNGQNRLMEIETAINNSISEIELTALQAEKTTLEGLIIEWERNYTQLLTLTEPKRDPTQLSIVEPAHSSNRIVRPRVQLNTILGGAVGMVLALGLIFLLDFLDDTYKSLKNFSGSEEVNILGSIRKIKGKKLSDKLVAHLQPHSPITESYRIIRSRIRFKPTDNLARSIMVTNSMPEEGDGKSVTAANLAVVFAQANFKTVIVDADLRHPVLHEVFDLENEAGLGDMLSSREMKLEDCIKNTSVNNLQILTSGEPLPDPSGQLGSERMAEIITELKKIAEIIIFDTPPVLVFADAVVLSRRIDGVIVVIEAGKSKRSAINQTLIDLQNANLLGSIFNQAPKSDTFSVNKVYMQERPQLPFTRALVKKEDQFSDLRDSAMPLRENLEIPGSNDEKVSTFKSQFSDLGDSAMSSIENLEITASDNGTHGPKTNVPYDTKAVMGANHKKLAQSRDLIDSAASKNENLEISGLDDEKVSVDEMQIPDLDDSTVLSNENPEISGLDDEKAIVDEMQTHDVGDSAMPVVEGLELPSLDEVHVEEANVQQKRKRNRKSKRKELKSEGVSVGSPDDPIDQTNE